MEDIFQKIKSRLATDEEGNNIEKNNPYNEEFSYLDFHQDRLKYIFRLMQGYYEPGAKFLEIGSLFGYTCLGAKLIGYQASGLDLVKYVEQFSSRYKRYQIDNRACNLETESIPFADGSFNLIVASEVIEHFNFHPLQFLKEVNRVLAPGGRFVITTPNLIRLNNVFKMLAGRSINWDINEEYWDGVHRREFTAAELVSLVEKSGLKIETILYSNFSYPKISQLVKFINKISGYFFPSRQGNIILIANKAI